MEPLITKDRRREVPPLLECLKTPICHADRDQAVSLENVPLSLFCQDRKPTVNAARRGSYDASGNRLLPGGHLPGEPKLPPSCKERVVLL